MSDSAPDQPAPQLSETDRLMHLSSLKQAVTSWLRIFSSVFVVSWERTIAIWTVAHGDLLEITTGSFIRVLLKNERFAPGILDSIGSVM